MEKEKAFRCPATGLRVSPGLGGGGCRESFGVLRISPGVGCGWYRASLAAFRGEVDAFRGSIGGGRTSFGATRGELGAFRGSIDCDRTSLAVLRRGVEVFRGSIDWDRTSIAAPRVSLGAGDDGCRASFGALRGVFGAYRESVGRSRA